ncbi:MAG TPA: hypothetical protein GXZ20_09435 [Halanaerobiaceae bacterium]|nr:hypothetical protein [Halanaerobiaceae bacterium]HOA41558.1 hypothetical protein [Halanaerobiales bacterium]HPZ63651.1 hypothetical protein [Halanaerobiales bacterium]HQD04904.1 hypothetical protein [Halanaerobiales bacterium]
MKKRIILPLLILSFLMISVTILADNTKYIGQNIDYQVGLDLPNVGWAYHDEEGNLKGFRGINLGLGYSQKTYFEPGLKEGKFNNFWGWGTVALIIPYGEIGTEYPFALQENGSFWTVGGALYVYFPIIPGARIGVSYHF